MIVFLFYALVLYKGGHSSGTFTLVLSADQPGIMELCLVYFMEAII